MSDNASCTEVPWADLSAYRARFRASAPVLPVESVVADLAERAQWLMWRYEPGETPIAKPRKVPYYASGRRRGGKQGDDKDRACLVNYQRIADAVRQVDANGNGWDGVGFAFLPNDGLVGIDLDGMINPETGEIAERCSSIIAACGTYTEFSPSAKGVHIIGRGHIEKSVKDNGIGVEVFCGAQFFTFTGRPWPGGVAMVEEIPPKTLARLELTIKEAKKAAAANRGTAQPEVTVDHAPPSKTNAGGRDRSLAETVAMAEEALQHIDPSDYHRWIKIGHACKASLGAAGYMVWDAWSARAADKYAGAADTAKRWNTFQPNEVDIGAVFAIAEESGWVAPWTKARAKKPRKPAAEKAPPPYKAPAGEGGDEPPMDDAPPASPPPDDDWQRDLIKKKGDLSPCLANAELILSHMPAWQGVVAYDEFSEKTVFRRPLPFDRSGPESGEWSDHIDVKSTIWLQRAWHVEFSTQTVGKAVESMARDNRFHPVREALKALPPWDGTRRNGDWLSDYLGVEKTEYTTLIGTLFMRGIVKRVMQPGCKFDYCPVLEGPQGTGKSSVARILAWNWFCDTDLDLSNKDSLLALPGHLVYEIAEMGSLMKAEERKQKSFLSRQEDEYRPPYATRIVKVPRQNVFIGTTNEEEYLKDATGARRFWPVCCGDSFNLEGLLAARDQMYAEALADYYAGERVFPTPDEQKRLCTPEQAKRGMQEPYDDLLATWVKSRVAPFSMADAITDGLNLTADKMTPALVTRVGIALKRLGCGREEHRLSADPGERRMYLPPVSKGVSSDGTDHAEQEACHAGF